MIGLPFKKTILAALLVLVVMLRTPPFLRLRPVDLEVLDHGASGRVRLPSHPQI